MGKEGIFGIVFFSVMLVGAVNTVWQIYKIVGLDAESRGLKHPRLWGFFAANTNGSSGLILYLIGRRKYPVIRLSEETRREIESRKKRAGAGLVFLAVGMMRIVITGVLAG